MEITVKITLDMDKYRAKHGGEEWYQELSAEDMKAAVLDVLGEGLYDWRVLDAVKITAE